MSFERDFRSVRSRLHLTQVPMKAIAFIALLCIGVIVLAAINLAGSFRTAELVVESEGAAVVVSDDGPADMGDSEESSVSAPVVVHVGGAVVSPGVYELPGGSRVQDGVDAAGGFAADADVDSVNCARVLTDGEQVVIARVSPEGESAAGEAAVVEGSGKVNVNVASVEELDELKGVGPATAEAIVSYREENGPFSSAEDLLEVPGIGESKLEGMRDQVAF